VTDGDDGARMRGTYLSYLLRLWQVYGQESSLWRASLQSTQTRQQVTFAGLEELFEYLHTETGMKDEGHAHGSSR
jgi:hypothetical protein